ncbi:STELLO glycosyltransferase family protein [Sporolactobacillus sp. CQH2019]|uniref:STELLO glycosyltransferase family protein n=1 Tax=Sporolactobacillus sp. CQH2019 TaxID=3023512 RepID=UPI002367CE85|nr:STELLO glycosyltransferase family protein [Sporolactobacillus sp. CQH2019]MDD9148839.1 STELLO glycosyltransferase family protein [Sporolactobacillus sp. CQH2019]
MKNIIITSIFNPTEAVAEFTHFKDYQLIVVGDKKTPKDWNCSSAKFISEDEQIKSHFEINQLLPWNHYCRKMIGYVYAIKNGSEVIVDTDDDNIPYSDWKVEEFDGEFLTSEEERGFINIYHYFTDKKIWPRGLPLNKINDKDALLDMEKFKKQQVSVGVWQGLANGDPDVDAIYRLTSNEVCNFRKKEPLVLSEGTISPFNSQNTAFRKEVFPLLYLPAYVTFRFTDILRGLVAQPILWSAGFKLGFSNATVFQERNDHNYVKDFESEIPCYLHSEEVIDIVEGTIRGNNDISNNLFNAYEALYKKDIVEKRELELLNAWLIDIND